MANWLTRGFERLGNAVGRVLGREPDVARVPTGPLPGEQRPGLGERIRNIVQPGRVEQERQAQEQERQREETRQEQERQRQELQRQQEELTRQREEIRLEQERLRQEIEQQRQALEQQREETRQEQERLRQEQERQRVEQERQERERLEQERQAQVERDRQAAKREAADRQQREAQEREDWRKNVGIDKEVTGGKAAGVSWTIYTVRTPEELMQRLRDAADAGKRVGLSVHDKNGWQQLYVNKGRGQPIDPNTGMLIGGGAGISASELRDRLEKYGVPGAELPADGGTTMSGVGDFPGGDGDIDMSEGGILDGPEWDYEESEDGDYDGGDYDVDESEGGDEDNEYAGYDGGSVNGYQLVVY